MLFLSQELQRHVNSSKYYYFLLNKLKTMAKKLLDTPESENKKELKSESKNIEKSKQDKKKEKKISNKKMLNKSPNGFSMWRIY
jgi:hypothetical protein